jgi:hypothetical protein
MNKFWFKLFILKLAFGLPCVAAQVPGTYKVIVEKQEQKKNSRWTLADWLQQKRDMRMQDLWLAKNSYSSPFEFYLGGGLTNYQEQNGNQKGDNHNLENGEFGAYAGRAGLTGRYYGDEEKRAVWEGALGFRIYGRAIQDTHITLEWGFRGQNVEDPQGEKFQNQFGAVNMDFYLTKYFGLGGRYARILPARSDLKNTLQGEESSAQVFIDFWALRVYGEWRNELTQTKSQGIKTAEHRSGFGGGLRFFF